MGCVFQVKRPVRSRELRDEGGLDLNAEDLLEQCKKYKELKTGRKKHGKTELSSNTAAMEGQDLTMNTGNVLTFLIFIYL